MFSFKYWRNKFTTFVFKKTWFCVIWWQIVSWNAVLFTKEILICLGNDDQRIDYEWPNIDLNVKYKILKLVFFLPSSSIYLCWENICWPLNIFSVEWKSHYVHTSRDQNSNGWPVKTSDNWKQARSKMSVIEKKNRNEYTKKEKYLYTSRSVDFNHIKSVFIINTTWQTAYKNCWKALQTSHHGQLSSIKMHHSERLVSFKFWIWKQCGAVIKWINIESIGLSLDSSESDSSESD